MSNVNKKKMFIVSGIACVFLLIIAWLQDLNISNTFINYNSLFGTLFQTFGEFPVYLIFVLSGEITMSYAIRKKREPLLAIPLFIGGLALSAWQTKQYINEVLSYLSSILSNVDSGKAIGLANSDSSVEGFSFVMSLLVWILFYMVITISTQLWLRSMTNEVIEKYMKIAVFASLTVWFSLEVNHALKDLWGRVRPYELSGSQKEFTSWLQINGVNGHKSFPSGHTMAGTLCIVFSWFVAAAKRKYFFIAGIIYGALMGISRVIIGAHYFSDVVFSFFLTALIIYVMNELHKSLMLKNRHKRADENLMN